MGLFDRMSEDCHEQVVFFRDKKSKLKAVVAFHNTILGPALGGTRMYPYSSEDEAVEDVLRLAKGMTYKLAAAGSNFGGGKAVIWGDPSRDKSEALFRAYGRFVQSLAGRFFTGTDVGTNPEDFVYCLPETDCIVGLPEQFGGSGDTSVSTAWGVFWGIRACVEVALGLDHLQDVTVAIQGLGKVGMKVAGLLKDAGARLVVSDIRGELAERSRAELGALVVGPDEVLEYPAEVLSPNAMGGVLNERTIPRLRCRVVAGAANNQLETADDARRVHERGILYAPDYVINAGGAIQVADELEGFSPERTRMKIKRIPELLKEIFRISREENIDTERAAERFVEERLQSVLELKSIYIPER